ncbi:chemotaxis protein [Bradyrhizobium huanghuaihaiense]|uniref:cache domain-containing protein n=1 Tax=Bradyrhizobium huanghuaihaiense TaxID=990078 RepID=UPI0021A9BC96|nr:chemotaxis protein [Bradyrhizobium sp. CB3035]UWU79109.1 chemotaxis protein [Bradyrhizobium sp. CB3035]
MIRIILSGVASLLFTQAAIGQQYGTASEARAMLERVIAGIKADPVATIEQINKGAPTFSDRDLYPTCAGPDGKMVANPNPARLGIVQKDSKDASGKPYGEELAKAQEGVVSEVSYLSPRPGTDKTPEDRFRYESRGIHLPCRVLPLIFASPDTSRNVRLIPSIMMPSPAMSPTGPCLTLAQSA